VPTSPETLGLMPETPHAEYLLGKENCHADWESHHYHDNTDWQLFSAVFKVLYCLLDPFSVDLFANTQLPLYYSWRPDPQAKAVDAFSVPWAQDIPYVICHSM